MKPIQRLIKKLNANFKGAEGWTEIPIDYPIDSHRTATLERGGFRWQFKGNRTLIEKYGYGTVACLSDLGSCWRVTDLLKYDKFKLFYDNGGWEILPEENSP